MTLQDSVNLTAEGIIRSLSEAERAQIEATGQAVDNANWFWGAKAAEWIRRGLPKMLVYAALARLVGRSSTTIRNCYYTSVLFDNYDREEYHMVAWSIFNHARQCSDPDAVLDYARDERAGIDEVEQQFPITPEREEPQPRNVPVWAMPMYRRFEGLAAEAKERAKVLMDELIAILEAA